MKRFPILTLMLLSTLGIGCNTNTSDKSLPLEAPSRPEAYSTKLVDALTSANSDELTYVFKGYERVGNNAYIKVHAVGDHINAELPILVKQWHKLETLKRTQGKGYIGAELRGLELVQTQDEIARFEYKTLDRIID
ncbi:hypothetical protein [Pedobacter sp.]|uniref:hypothetical protein n=1 Tax=Pedobacter sp. TaxID=1411316 RepID=UPI003D7F61E7